MSGLVDKECPMCQIPIEDDYPIEGELYDCGGCGTRFFYEWSPDADGLVLEEC